MTHSIYTQVSNADIVPCKKGQSIKSEPIPLLRDKYLGEYRTELEKAKVRKNLGIPDENSMTWGNIEGFVEEQKDLVQYVESKWLYTNKISEDITNVKEALDYTIYFISNFKANTEAIEDLNEKVKEITDNLTEVENNLQKDIDTNSENITKLFDDVSKINTSISELNEALQTINVDANILSWVSEKLKGSQTIYFSSEDTLDVKISEQENNAINLSEGLYVKDFSEEINTHSENITKVQEDIQKIEESTLYSTQLSDDTSAPVTVGGVTQGTTVAQLKGKTLIEIIDAVIFPTSVRDLVYPTLSYSYVSYLVKVGTSITKPTLTFIQNDAGIETSRIDELLFDGVEVTSSTYDQLGTYTYKGQVSYEAGEYLVDNKGQITNKRVEAGTLNTTTSVTTTYPWYAGNTASVSEQQLVQFGVNSGEIDFSMIDKAVIKLPGANTTIISFKSDGGMGYLDVDLDGWIESTETLNGITYKVWTKQDSYVSNIPHRINFKLEL